jgi:hypothetical protein
MSHGRTGIFHTTGTVRFRAIYVQDGPRHVLAETSKFIREDKLWTYLGPRDQDRDVFAAGHMNAKISLTSDVIGVIMSFTTNRSRFSRNPGESHAQGENSRADDRGERAYRCVRRDDDNIRSRGFRRPHDVGRAVYPHVARHH